MEIKGRISYRDKAFVEMKISDRQPDRYCRMQEIPGYQKNLEMERDGCGFLVNSIDPCGISDICGRDADL